MRKVLLAALVLALPMGTAACSNRQRIHTEKQVAKALISDEQEEQLGLQVKQELAKQNVKIMTDPVVQAYADGIGRKIFPLADKDRKGVHWHVHVVDDPKVVNAFATPGGHLYLFSGLLLVADNEAEVAGVLAHEAGHVVGRHSARQLVNALGIQTVASMALGENPSMLSQVATVLAAQGVLLAHSRSEEHEADVYGVKYAGLAGYNPMGIATFFKRLKSKEGKMPGWTVWLQSHPATSDRIRNVQKLAKKYGFRGGATNEAGHDRIRQHLRSLSPQAGQPEPAH